MLCFASSSFQLTRSDTDMSTESTRKQTRPTRARYLPPHMRPQNANAGGFPDTPTAEFTRPRFNSPLPARTTPAVEVAAVDPFPPTAGAQTGNMKSSMS